MNQTKNFRIKTMRCEWQVVIQQVDQYGMSIRGDRSVLESWPTSKEAYLDLPNHGNKHRYVTGRWIPKNPKHDYEILEVQYQEVEV
jgi:hypothetical protein